MANENGKTTAVVKRETLNISLDNGIKPKNYDELMQFAALVAGSGLAPKTLIDPSDPKGTISKLALALMSNMEAGRPVILGLQDLAVINGKLTVYGDGAFAMIRNSGVFDEEAFEETETGEYRKPGWTFKCTVRRLPNGRPKTGVYTWDEAINAGLDKIGPPSPWAKFTRRMMTWKARNFVMRDLFNDVLRGMKIAEEQYDAIDLEQTASGAFATPEQKAADLGEQLTDAGKTVKEVETVELPTGPTGDVIAEEEIVAHKPGPAEQKLLDETDPEARDEAAMIYSFSGELHGLKVDDAIKKLNGLQKTGIVKFFEENSNQVPQGVKIKAQSKYMKILGETPPPFKLEVQPTPEQPAAPENDKGAFSTTSKEKTGATILCGKKETQVLVEVACEKLCQNKDGCEDYNAYVGVATEGKVQQGADTEASAPTEDKTAAFLKFMEEIVGVLGKKTYFLCLMQEFHVKQAEDVPEMEMADVVSRMIEHCQANEVTPPVVPEILTK